VFADLSHRTLHGTVYLLGAFGMLTVAVWSKRRDDSGGVAQDSN
jgi:hypothetical protein